MTDLKALSDAATPGGWRIDGNRRVYGPDGRSICVAHLTGRPGGEEVAEANAAYVCALVNAHRAGELVEVGGVETLRGKAEKLAEALEHYADNGMAYSGFDVSGVARAALDEWRK